MTPNQKAQDPTSRKIRVLSWVVQFGFLGLVALAFLIEPWLGAIAAVLWILFANVAAIGLLGAFWGVNRVRDAELGHLVSGPTQPLSQPSPLDRLVGAAGRSATPLEPEGYVDVAGERYQARTDEGVLPADTDVVVVDNRLERLVVVEKRDD